MLKELAQMNCVFQDPHPKKSILRKEGQLGTSHKIQFSRCTWHNVKLREKRVHRQVLFRSVSLMSVVFALKNSLAARAMRPQSRVESC